MLKRLVLALAAAVLLLGGSGCDTGRLTRFGTFAAAGTAYVTAFHLFTREAGRAFVAADSATLMTAHNEAPDLISTHADFYARTVTAQDAQMTTYLLNLQRLDLQASLLGEYFAAITRLTDGKASAGTVAALNGLTDALSQLNPQVETVSFGGKSVRQIAGAVDAVTVAHLEAKALDRELRRSAPVLDRALALQEAAVELIAEQMHAAQAATSRVEESTRIVHPYASNGVLPPAWAAQRNAFLERQSTLGGADAARQSIAALRAAFRQLLADPRAQPDLSALLQEIGRLGALASTASATSATSQ